MGVLVMFMGPFMPKRLNKDIKTVHYYLELC